MPVTSRLAAAIAAAVVMTGCAGSSGVPAVSPTTGETATRAPAAIATATEEPAAPEPLAREFPSGIVPTRVRIPAIGVDASVTELSLAGAEPEVPTDFDQVGWYHQTRKPGEIGPAVLAGHVDSLSGPAVFVDLAELGQGDEIVVADAAGEERRFVVEELGQYPKEDLPPEVFGFGGPQPDLRLITCGGSFDRASGHYRDNVVVYARLVGA
ncbi:MAG TPA: class F sortase [Egicoccus sp.]|nr:class F sortase [Egicoccus sp.]HSK24271.1 class F sortase [Egicoccus sp.]